MRITQRAVALTSLQGLNSNLDAVGRLQQQLTSGRLISRPSDSPTGTNTAMQARGDITAGEQYARNITDGQNRLDVTGSTLVTMLGEVRRVRDLALQASNTGATSGAAAQAIAVEVEQIQQSLLTSANRSLQGRSLFGGVSSAPSAYDAAGGYLGRGGGPGEQVLRRISDTETIRVDITGAEAFGDQGAGDDLFAVVAGLATAVRTGAVADLTTGLAALDGAMDRMLTAVADVGSRGTRIEKAAQLTQDNLLTLGSRLAETENIDLPKTVMELEMQRVGYEAALAATAKALQPTLVDFLR